MLNFVIKYMIIIPVILFFTRIINLLTLIGRITMKKILMIISAAIAILFSFSFLDIEGNKAKASTVGEQLKEPESGWQRFDDTHSAIKYTNFPYLGFKVTHAYKGLQALTPATQLKERYDLNLKVRTLELLHLQGLQIIEQVV